MKLQQIGIYALLMSAGIAPAQAYDANFGKWQVNVSEDTHRLNITHDGKDILKDAYATVAYNFLGKEETHTMASGDAAPEISIENAQDCFGSGKSLVIATSAGGAVMKQRLNFYDTLPYFIVSVSVEGANGEVMQSNTMVPLATESRTNPFNGSNNRFITVPYDNDGHGRYHNNRISSETLTSHEVTAVYDAASRYGLVTGSVDHDKWKSAVSFSAYGKGFGIQSLQLLSGFAGPTTRDVCPHGKVKGEVVESARFMFGMFDDWRVGMETFADANTTVVPPLEWNGGNPMGWSTWGVMMDNVNYDGVVQTAQWIKDNLYPLGFHNNEEKIVISLDSFAEDNIGTKISTLGNKVLGEGEYRIGKVTYQGLDMDMGMYCGPFVMWGWVVDSQIWGTGLMGQPSYTWGQAALKHNGEYIKVDSNSAYAIDPTHPAIRQHIQAFMDKYARYGAKYVKVDFLNNGQCEGDSWYDPEVTTGTMAYNYGMKILREEAEKYGMYVVESIAPIFPYQYAHGRRQTCDRFSEIGESEYVMNAISYGWWTDRLYAVNDPDQLVLCKAGHNAAESMGENRARATTGMTSGAFIFGDNLAAPGVVVKDGVDVGYPEESRRRALEIMGNADINDYVRNNMGSFRPVEGGSPTSSADNTSGQESESIFMRDTEEYLYVAVFNFARGVFGKRSEGDILFSRIGIDPSNVGAIKELWSGEEIAADADRFHYNVPKSDVCVYRISKKDASGVGSIKDSGSRDAGIHAFITLQGLCRITSESAIASVKAYNVNGALVGSWNGTSDTTVAFPISESKGSLVIVSCLLDDGTCRTAKCTM